MILLTLDFFLLDFFFALPAGEPDGAVWQLEDTVHTHIDQRECIGFRQERV